MNDRIRQFLSTENKSSAQFAEEIGVQPSGISHILSGRNKPSLDFILKMLERYTNLSVEWLLFGRGSMYTNKAPDLFQQQIINGDDETDLQLSGDKNVTPSSFMERSGSQPGRYEKSQNATKIVWFYDDKSFEEFYPRK